MELPLFSGPWLFPRFRWRQHNTIQFRIRVQWALQRLTPPKSRGARPRGGNALPRALPGTHHALDDAPERTPLDVLGDEVEPLVLVEHPDEPEHIGVLQASHDLHLVGSKQAGPGAVPMSLSPSTVSPEPTDGPKDGGASSFNVWLECHILLGPLPPTLSGEKVWGPQHVLEVCRRGCAVPPTDLLEKCPLCLLVKSNQLLHDHHLSRLPVCHLHGDTEAWIQTEAPL